MSLATVHDTLEQQCPNGAGFAIHYSIVARLLGQAVQEIMAEPMLHTGLPLFVTTRIQFSFYINPATIKVEADWRLSLNLDIVLHLPREPNAEIVRVSYAVVRAGLTGYYDRASDRCSWKPAATSAIDKVSESWEPTGVNLAKAGFADAKGDADKQRFLNEVFYGFVWNNSAQLLPTILQAVPFPQIQRWLGPIRLAGVLQLVTVDQHLVVWSNDVDIIDVHCGGGPIPRPAVETSWIAVEGNTRGSPWDGDEPLLGLYIGAKTLLDWHAGYLAPAIAFHESGGGFIKYEVDAALSLQRLRLTLRTNRSDGGSLALDAGLRLLAHADSYLEGPCGTHLSVLNATLTGDASASATLGISLDRTAKALMLDLDLSADVDRHSIKIDTGGLPDGLLGILIELLYKAGIVKIDTAFRNRTRVNILDLSAFDVPFMKSRRRVGACSMFLPIFQDG